MPGRIDHNNMDVVSDHVKRETLKEYDWKNTNFNEHRGMSVEAANDTYKEYELAQKFQRLLAEEYNFPIHSSDALNTGDKWSSICLIDLSKGGCFILSKSIPVERIPEVFKLLATFVDFDEEDKPHTNWEKNGDVYFSIPKMYIESAKKYFLYSLGYCLLRGTLCHGHGNRTEFIDNKMVKFINYNGQLGIHLNNICIPLSMKKDTTLVTLLQQRISLSAQAASA